MCTVLCVRAEYEYFNRNTHATLIDTSRYRTSQPEEIVSRVPAVISKHIFNQPVHYLKPLSLFLTSETEDELLKAKIIHDWICLNIRYDVSGYNSANIQIVDPYVTLRKRKAVCSGYATLFNVMARISGLESEYITGYTKGDSTYNFDRSNLSGHAWNAVAVKGNWYLLDVTWNSGFVEQSHFVYRYSTDHLFLDPAVFVISHFPKAPGWLLIDQAVTVEAFKKNHSHGESKMISEKSGQQVDPY
jgi:hypothetical protein